MDEIRGKYGKNKMITPSQKSDCVLWYHKDGRPKSVQKKFRKKYRQNVKSHDPKIIKKLST